MTDPNSRAFGVGDASFLAAGGSAGLLNLSRCFYKHMSSLPEAARILAMHPPDLELSIDKLATFLGGWLGGPRLYAARFGAPIRIPAAHAHLAIDEPERDAWLLCMSHAVAEQPWSAEFKVYFLSAIAVPAERVRVTSVACRAG